MSSNQEIIAGSAYSIWLRPLRYLLEHGKTLPQITMLAFGPTPDGPLPFGAICSTRNQRLVFWPPLPRNPEMVLEDGKTFIGDHVTLELANWQSHVTSFDGEGARRHHRQGWQVHAFPDSGLAIWFSLAIRLSLLIDQDKQVEVKVRSPVSDQKRRTDEFTKFVQNLKSHSILSPVDTPGGDYVFIVFYLITDSTREVTLSEKHFLAGNIDSCIDDFPDGTVFGIRTTKLIVGESELAVALACPPGKLKDDVVFGFPTS